MIHRHRSALQARKPGRKERATSKCNTDDTMQQLKAASLATLLWFSFQLGSSNGAKKAVAPTGWSDVFSFLDTSRARSCCTARVRNNYCRGSRPPAIIGLSNFEYTLHLQTTGTWRIYFYAKYGSLATVPKNIL